MKASEVLDLVRSEGCFPKHGHALFHRWMNMLGKARQEPQGLGHAEVLSLYDELRDEMNADRRMQVVNAVRSAGSLPKPGDAYYSRWTNMLHLARSYPDGRGHKEVLSLYDELRDEMNADSRMQVVNAVRSAGSLPKPGDAHYRRWNGLLQSARNEPEGPGHVDALSVYNEVCHLSARSRREGGVKRKGKVRFRLSMRWFPKYADAKLRYLNFLREKETFPFERRRFRGSGVGELWNESYVAEWRRRRYRFVKDDEVSKAERALDLRLIHEIADFWEASFVWPSDIRLVEYMRWRSVYYVSVLS